jgi:acyl dehydratase
VHEHAKGSVLCEVREVVSAARLRALARAIGTDSGEQTASLVPFFGPTVGGEGTVVDGLGLDLSRALLGGVAYEWKRPFRPDETVTVRVTVDDVYARGRNQFGVVVAEFRDDDDELVQRQTTTFVERQPA